MKVFFIATILFGLSLPLLTQAKGNCFSRHINEAIRLNLERRPLYSKATNGRSLAISNELISLEKSMKFQSLLVDTWGRFFQIQGLPVLCNDLADMDEAPSFSSSLPLESSPHLSNFIRLDIKKIQKNLGEKAQQDFKSLARETKSQIQILLSEPRFHCVTRHFLESIYIFATHGQEYTSEISYLQKSHLRLFIKKIIKAHINYLTETARLDLMAKELQSEGYPILCQDLPHLETSRLNLGNTDQH